MFKFLKQPKFSITIFTAAGIAALILLPIFFIILKSILTTEEKSAPASSQTAPEKCYDMTDPFITKVVGCDEIIKNF